MSKLSPAIKRLLTLRQPDFLPSPPAAKLRKILSSTFLDAKQRNAEKGWLVLTTCTLLTVNRPSSLGHLYRFATKSDQGEPRVDVKQATDTAAIIREAALKSTIFVGVPRALNSLGGLTEALEDDVKAALRKESLRTPTPENVNSVLSRGRSLWDSIYAPFGDKLHAKLASYHPDFISFIIQAYGAVLAPLPQAEVQGNLSQALGSVVGTACLRAERGTGPQLKSHVFGLVKARELDGLSEEDEWLSSDEGTEWVITTVDNIYDAVQDESIQAKL